MISSALAVLVLLSGGPQERPVPETLLDRSTADLARAFSVPGADAIQWHELKPALRMAPPLPPGVTFQGTLRFVQATTPSAPGVCRREVLEVFIEERGGQVLPRGEGRPVTEIGVARDCNGDVRRRFAPVASDDIDPAAAQLSQLADIQNQLQSGRPAGISIRCQSEQQGFRCPRNAEALFAGLPLSQVYFIGRDYDTDALIIGTTEGEPGDPMWDIRLTENHLTMLRRIPAPF